MIVALLGVKTYENYVSYSGNLYDGSGNIVGSIGTNKVDPSGNVIDGSGNVVGNISSVGASTANVSKSGLITLSLTDLLSLFTKASAGSKQVTAQNKAPTAQELYTQIKPHLISDVQTAVRTSMAGAPYTPSVPIPSSGSCSDSMAQGMELQNAQAELIDSNEYIRKDSIPCYGCTLPQ